VIEPGTPAPDFTLRDQDGRKVSLEDLRGQTTVLVFYPLDFSPVCTDQLNVYDEVLDDLEREGAKLYGISVDSVYCHKAFQESLGIRIPLLADFHPKGAVAKAYGVYDEELGNASRALVMVGPDLTVEWAHCAPSALEIPGANLIFDALLSGDHERNAR
jgi:peroxiredoxin